MTHTIVEQFTVSDSATAQLSSLVKNEDNADIKGIRIFVSGSGCSGTQYGMTFADSVTKSDGVLKCNGVDIYVDEQCLATMDGIEIDFADGPSGASFVFNNTKKTESGCGTCPSSSAAGGGCG